MNTIPAVYEQGVFRPMVPVHLAEGTTVQIPTPIVPLDSVDESEARARFARLIGSVDLGAAIGTDNSAIDRDLAREYSGTP